MHVEHALAPLCYAPVREVIYFLFLRRSKWSAHFFSFLLICASVVSSSTPLFMVMHCEFLGSSDFIERNHVYFETPSFFSHLRRLILHSRPFLEAG